MSRLAWIIAALTEAAAAASWRLDALNTPTAAISDDQERVRVGEAYLSHDDATLRALLKRLMRHEELRGRCAAVPKNHSRVSGSRDDFFADRYHDLTRGDRCVLEKVQD